jgi:hypothetical protein
MALQITLGLEPSIHAGWRAVRAKNGLKVDKLGLEKSTVWDPDVGPKTGKNHDFLLVQQKPLQISGRLRIQVDT